MKGSIFHVAMETTKTSHFNCQSKSFISIFFTCQVSAGDLQPFSYHDLANDIYSQTAKAVFSHLYYRSSFVITYSVIPEMGLSHKNIIIGNDPNAPNTTGITFVLTTHIFRTSFSRSCYFSNFSFSFSHTLPTSTVATLYILLIVTYCNVQGFIFAIEIGNLSIPENLVVRPNDTRPYTPYM